MPSNATTGDKIGTLKTFSITGRMGRNFILVAVFFSFLNILAATYVSVSPDGYQDVVISIDENPTLSKLTCDQIAEKLHQINVRSLFISFSLLRHSLTSLSVAVT